ncbi:MAG: DUF4160 domain-containing protein [Bacteroidota bacterium]
MSGLLRDTAAAKARATGDAVVGHASSVSSMTFEEVIANRVRAAETLKELAETLQGLLTNHSVSEDGHLLSIRALVDYIKGLKIEVRPNEHPPAHFHVLGEKIDASFAIDDCRLLRGIISDRELKLVIVWFRFARPKLIRRWNETRPTDCPVGLISE